MKRPPIESYKKTYDEQLAGRVSVPLKTLLVTCDYALSLEAEIIRLQEALKGLVNLLGTPDPVEVGCHCTDTGDSTITCAWCKAKQALESAKE